MRKVLTIAMFSLAMSGMVGCNNNSDRVTEISTQLKSKSDSIKLYKDSLEYILHHYYIFKNVWTSFEKVSTNKDIVTYQYNLCGDGLLMEDSIVYSKIMTPDSLTGVKVYKENFRNFIQIDRSLENDSLPFILHYYYSDEFRLYFPHIHSD